MMLINNGSSQDEDLQPTTIMRNVYGVFPSFAMLAAMQLDLFTYLKDGPMEARALARALDAQENKLAPLLYLLVVAGLLEVENNSFSNTPEAAKFLVRGCPGYIGGLSGFYNMLWQVSLNTAESIRTGKPNAKIDYHALPEEELLAFFQKQIHSSRNGGKEIAKKLDFSKFKRLLDAGGGTGGVSIAICTKYPHLKATVVDLPKVVRLAEGFIAEAGMSDRISVSVTDLCSTPPEGKYDVAILRAVIQTLSQEEALAVLKSISQSMLPGGRIFIFGSVLDDSRLGPPASLANGFANLNVYDHGQAYTETEYREMLINAEFINIVIEHDALVDGMDMVSGEKKSESITAGTELRRNNVFSDEDDLKPATIMHNVYGVLPSFAMLAGMQFDLFTPLKDGPMSANVLAGALHVEADKLTPLLYLLVVAGLLEVENKKFSNTPEAAKFLVRGCPDYMGELSGFYKMLWQNSLHTAETIRTGQPQAKHDFHTLSAEEVLAFFQRQIPSSRKGGKEIAEKLDFSPFKSLLDAGGGSGGVAMAICTKYPHLKATVADLPQVAQLAERFIAEAGMSERIGISETDLCSNPPAGEYDVAVLRAVIQTLSKEEAQAVLKFVSQSMAPGGRIYIFGIILDNSCLGPPASLAFAMVFLNTYDQGQAYTETEYREMLTKAGFTDIIVQHNVLADGMGMVSAKKQ